MACFSAKVTFSCLGSELLAFYAIILLLQDILFNFGLRSILKLTFSIFILGEVCFLICVINFLKIIFQLYSTHLLQLSLETQNRTHFLKIFSFEFRQIQNAACGGSS